MLLLVYEYLTGGGLWSEPTADVSEHPLLAEGNSMVSALADDLARIPDTELVLMRDARLPCRPLPGIRTIEVHSAEDERALLVAWSGKADRTLLIAPEYDDQLSDRCHLVEQHHGTLMSPSAKFVDLATDKQATCARLASNGIPTPSGSVVPTLPESSEEMLSSPFVIKPVDGVGSLDTHLVSSQTEWDTIRSELKHDPTRLWLLEPFHCGLPVSVSALCGPRGHVLLPPCVQQLSSSNGFSYAGGKYPLEAKFEARACNLARRTLAALPPTIGYIGIDLVLGNDANGNDDVVLEVNPRLTTSYVGLRHATRCNLAHAMLDIGRGQTHPLFFQSDPVTFDCEGKV